MKQPTFKILREHPAYLLACGFGSGLSPRAPGTAGTLVGVLIYLLLRPLPLYPYLILVVLSTIIGIWLCGITARRLQTHDHPAIVWDEIAGYLITMCSAPVGWIWPIVGFIAFRFFDILKPWPISLLDRRVPGGLGIMIDDVLAGALAWLVVQGLAQWLQHSSALPL